MKLSPWKRLCTAVPALVTALSLTACGIVPSASPEKTVNLTEGLSPVSHIEVQPPDQAAATKLTDFGLRLAWHSMAGSRNALISPVSVATALAMTANGAEGETLAELEAVLGLDKHTLNSALRAYWRSLPTREQTAIGAANSIWLTNQEGFTVNQEFLEACAEYEDAAVFQTPMDAGTIRDINRWVKDKTTGMIPRMIESVPPNAMVYLVNALAFEGAWEEPYQKHQVQEGVFLTDSGPVKTTFLHSQEYKYLENELATGVMKLYQGGDYAFVGLLPKGDLSLMGLLYALDGESLQALLHTPQETAVQTCIPKFETRYDRNLREALTDMGISRAFTEQAEFGAMGTSETGPIILSNVLHQTVLSLNEQGTRAGAATVVEVKDGCAMPEEVKEVFLDQPFVYLLVDTNSCVPLFIGTMVDPTGTAPEQLAGGPPLSVYVDGSLYECTGKELNPGPRCGTMDGEITSSVGRGEVPAQNHQSNFGTGWGYQGSGSAITVKIGRHWIIFEQSQEDLK